MSKYNESPDFPPKYSLFQLKNSQQQQNKQTPSNSEEKS
jgi:hypothetical protein